MSCLGEDDCASLFAALHAADSGDVSQLDAWVSEHGVDQDVIIAEHVLDSHKGKQLNNMGRPVYIAVVRDQTQAVEHLIKSRADINCIHPSHGDTCLLHASQNGYDECLHVLLRRKELKPTSHLTIDRKIFLGQGMPQWEEGGQSALMVAACNGRVEAVKLLLQRDDSVAHWMTCTDTFGRTALQATCDSIALCKEGTGKQEDLKTIAGLLMKQNGVEDVESELMKTIPSRSNAEQQQRERTIAVRARCLAAEQERKDAERRRGLAAIAQHYVPLHPETKDVGAIRSACVGDAAIVAEPLPGVFSFPLLSEDMCRKVWEELHHYEDAACSNPAWELPLPVRHDGNLGELQDCGLSALLEGLLAACRPLLRSNMPALGEVEAYHAFVTRNYEGREENATFKMHCDKSELTLNLCLHASEGFSGSTVGFYRAKNPGDVPGDEDRVYTHRHSVGTAVMHTGSTWHRTDPITSGTRGSLIVWARRRRGQRSVTVY